MRLIPRAAAAAPGMANAMADRLGSLGGSLVALVTPFRNGDVDTDTLALLCERQVNRGTAAVVVCGSTGEAPALSYEEQARAVATVVEAAAGRVPVIAGCGAPATDAAVNLASGAARVGVDGLLCAPPPYSRPTQDGIVAHVRAVAHASNLPVIVYDIPSRVGAAVTDDTVARLHDAGSVVGIKDAAGDLTRPGRLRGRCGPGFVQFGGGDATAAAYRAMGGHGCISVTANLAPALCAQMHAAWDRMDMPEFARLRDVLAPVHAVMALESNPIPVKAALCLAGLCNGDLRLPLTRASSPTLAVLAAVLPELLRAEDHATRLPRLSVVR